MLDTGYFALEDHCDETAAFARLVYDPKIAGRRQLDRLLPTASHNKAATRSTPEVDTVWIQEIWRYPVKSMAGESLQAADFTESGVLGDRIIQVRNASGRIVTARTRPLLLLRHSARLFFDNQGSGDQVLVDGRPWTAEDVKRDVEAAAGAGARLVRSGSKDRFAILPLLVAADGMLAAVGHDSGRFRPNLVIGSAPGLAEREREGAQLRIGPVVIGMEDLRARCIMTTFDAIPASKIWACCGAFKGNSMAGSASTVMWSPQAVSPWATPSN